MTRLAAALALCLLASTAIDPAGAECIQSPELRVIDGDNVEYAGQNVRMAGYNTAESGDRARCDQERDLSAAATERLEGLIDDHDTILCLPGTTCGYDRPCGVLLVLVEEERRTLTLPVGSILMAEGLAVPFTGTMGEWCQ